MSKYPTTESIMACIREAINESSRERAFALTDAARAGIEQLEDALDHVVRVARGGVTPTRRLDWIVKRGQRALDGLAPDSDDRPPENSVLELLKENAKLRTSISEAHVERDKAINDADRAIEIARAVEGKSRATDDAYALELREAAVAARSEMGKALYSETGVDRRGMEHAFHDIDAALAKNPNPSGHGNAEASSSPVSEASGPVGLGPNGNRNVAGPPAAPIDVAAAAKAWKALGLDGPVTGHIPRVELGCAGHFVAASSCRWRRHTQVGDYRISSIGNYFPFKACERETIGAGEDAFFETMVFKLTDQLDPKSEGCGCRVTEDWSEIEMDRYATAGEAQAGHERYVAKYAALHPHSSCSSQGEKR